MQRKLKREERLKASGVGSWGPLGAGSAKWVGLVLAFATRVALW